MKTLILLLGVMGCTHLTPLEQSLLNCGTQAVEQQIPSLVPQVTSILNSANVNWQSALDALLATGGDAVICAVQVVVTSMENGGATTLRNGMATPPSMNAVAIARGEAWLTIRSYK